MATQTTDYARALEFIHRIACDPAPVSPREEERRAALIDALTLGLRDASSGGACQSTAGVQILTSGWPEMEGVMILQPEPEFAADVRAAITAGRERALRDLLLAFPRGRLGFFSLSGEWMLPTLEEIFEGRAMPRDAGVSSAHPRGPAPSFVGIKRGSGSFSDTSPDRFFQRRRGAELRSESEQPDQGGQVSKSKDPILARFRDLSHAAGRRERSQFVVEGLRLVSRAVGDGLPVDAILYTPELPRGHEGGLLIDAARREGVRHYLLTEGLMGKVTTTRPVPTALAAVFGRLRDAGALEPARAATLLVAEEVNNPENLGMVLRTADAAGVGGVALVGEATDPFHKLCIRAARGAVGRLPLFECHDPLALVRGLREHGFRVLGATARADANLYGCEMQPPLAVIVGNEQSGISPELLDACTDRVRIPMAPGQDSLNVGVAAGVLLYELLRHRTAGSPTPRIE